MLVYTPYITPRIRYIIQLLSERWQIEIKLTEDKNLFQQSNDVKIAYAGEKVDDASFFIQSLGLLLQHDIRKQHTNCFEWENTSAFFQTGDDLGFDVFAAVF